MFGLFKRKGSGGGKDGDGGGKEGDAGEGKGGSKAAKSKSREDEEPIDGTRRSMMRMFINPVSSAVVGYKEPENPGIYSKPNAPGSKRVIRGGSEKELLGLLGPLAMGEPAPGGFRLGRVSARQETVDISFLRGGEVVLLSLSSVLIEGGKGIEAGTFRIRSEGNAAIADVEAVANAVAAEIAARDRGAAWAEVGIPPTA